MNHIHSPISSNVTDSRDKDSCQAPVDNNSARKTLKSNLAELTEASSQFDSLLPIPVFGRSWIKSLIICLDPDKCKRHHVARVGSAANPVVDEVVVACAISLWGVQLQKTSGAMPGRLLGCYYSTRQSPGGNQGGRVGLSTAKQHAPGAGVNDRDRDDLPAAEQGDSKPCGLIDYKPMTGGY